MAAIPESKAPALRGGEEDEEEDEKEEEEETATGGAGDSGDGDDEAAGDTGPSISTPASEALGTALLGAITPNLSQLSERLVELQVGNEILA